MKSPLPTVSTCQKAGSYQQPQSAQPAQPAVSYFLSTACPIAFVRSSNRYRAPHKGQEISSSRPCRIAAVSVGGAFASPKWPSGERKYSNISWPQREQNWRHRWAWTPELITISLALGAWATPALTGAGPHFFNRLHACCAPSVPIASPPRSMWRMIPLGSITNVVRLAR